MGRHGIFLVSLLGSVLLVTIGCSDSKTLKPPEGIDTDTGTDTGSDTEDTDTGENETPPDLPEDCTADEMDIDVELDGDGDGACPSIANGTSALVTWAYDTMDGDDPDWHLRTGPYDPLSTSVTTIAPMADTPLVEKPRMAHRDGSFGVAWLDGQWDSECQVTDLDSCGRDVAFMTFDSTGAATVTTPYRVTDMGTIETRPAVTGTQDGWLVLWQDQVSSNDATVLAASVSSDGTVGTAYEVSDVGGSDSSANFSVASVGGSALAVWLADDQQSIQARVLNLTGEGSGPVFAIDEGYHVSSPSLTAGSGEYLVSFGRKMHDDFEIYTTLVDDLGAPSGVFNRATWTTSDINISVPAWNGTDYALLWLSEKDNGASACVDAGDCDLQAFAARLDGDGAPSSSAVLISDNPNPAATPQFAADGDGWTGIWELRGFAGKKIVRGRIVCSN